VAYDGVYTQGLLCSIFLTALGRARLSGGIAEVATVWGNIFAHFRRADINITVASSAVVHRLQDVLVLFFLQWSSVLPT
jgi:hypothetical protein